MPLPAAAGRRQTSGREKFCLQDGPLHCLCLPLPMSGRQAAGCDILVWACQVKCICLTLHVRCRQAAGRDTLLLGRSGLLPLPAVPERRQADILCPSGRSDSSHLHAAADRWQPRGRQKRELKVVSRFISSFRRCRSTAGKGQAEPLPPCRV
jgi:hypothetical protein